MTTIPTTDCSFGDIVIAHNTTFPSTPVSTNNINLKTYFSGKTVYSPGGTGTLIPTSNISTSLFYGKTFQLPTPDPPTNILGVNNEQNQVTVSWTAPVSGTTPTGYKVEYQEVYPSVSGWTVAISDTGIVVTYPVTGLDNFIKAYKFRVSSVHNAEISGSVESLLSYTPRDLHLPQDWSDIQTYLKANGGAISEDNQITSPINGWYTIKMACLDSSNNTSWPGQGTNAGVDWYKCVGDLQSASSEPSGLGVVDPSSVENPFILVTNSSNQVIYKIDPRGARAINEPGWTPTFYGPNYHLASGDGITSVSYFEPTVNSPPTATPPSGCPGAGGGTWYNGITAASTDPPPLPTTRRIIDDCRLYLGYTWNWTTSLPPSDPHASPSSYSFGSSNTGPTDSLYTLIIN